GCERRQLRIGHDQGVPNPQIDQVLTHLSCDTGAEPHTGRGHFEGDLARHLTRLLIPGHEESYRAPANESQSMLHWLPVARRRLSRVRRFGALHDLGDVARNTLPEAWCEIVPHPVDEYEFRAGDGCGSRAPAADVAHRVRQTVN